MSIIGPIAFGTDEFHEHILADVLEKGAERDLLPDHGHIGHADPPLQRGSAAFHVRPVRTLEEQPELVQFLGLDVLPGLQLKPQVRSLCKCRLNALPPVLAVGLFRVLEHEHVERPSKNQHSCRPGQQGKGEWQQDRQDHGEHKDPRPQPKQGLRPTGQSLESPFLLQELGAQLGEFSGQGVQVGHGAWWWSASSMDRATDAQERERGPLSTKNAPLKARPFMIAGRVHSSMSSSSSGWALTAISRMHSQPSPFLRKMLK